MVSQHSRISSLALVVGAIGFIGWMTLRPAAGPTIPLPFGCLFCGTLGGVDFLLNVVLFVPLGFGLHRLLGSTRWTIALGIGFTLLIEALQWKFIPGRDASLGDLVANSLGTALGIVASVVIGSALYASGRLARRLAAAAALLASVVIGLSGWFLKPGIVRHALATQWKAPRPHMDNFTGEVYGATLNGKTLHPFEWVDAYWFNNANSRTVSMSANISGVVEPTSRQSIIIRLSNGPEEGFYLGQWKDAVVVRALQVGEKAKLRPVLFGFDGIFDPGMGERSIPLAINSNPRATTLSTEEGGQRTEMTIRRTVGLGWTLLLPWDVAVTRRWWPASAAWLAALLFPAGFFAFRSARHRGQTGVWTLVLPILVLLATPALFGLSFPGLTDWIGIAAGILLGATVERTIPTPIPVPLNRTAATGTIPS